MIGKTESSRTEAKHGNVTYQVDVSLVEYLLSLSPEERIAAHEEARKLFHDLRQAGEIHYARQPEGSA